MIKRILLIDDSRALATSLADILTMEGYEVTIVNNGVKAIAFLEKNIPNLIITDLIMPEMNGIEFIQNIRKEPRYKSIPIIAISADTREERAQEGIAAGANLFFTKPFDEYILIKSIEKLTAK